MSSNTTDYTSEPTAKPPTEPTAEQPAEPTAKPPAEPTAKPPTEPTAELPAEPEAEAPAEPEAELPAEPTAELPAKPVVKAPKKRRRKLIYIAVAVVTVIALIFGLVTWLRPEQVYASSCTLSVFQGTVLVSEDGGETWSEAVDGQELEPGDRIKTESDSYALITFFEGSTIEIEPDSEISIEELSTGKETGSTMVKLYQWAGATWSRIEKLIDPESQYGYEIETQDAVAAVRGTLLDLEVTEDGTTAGAYEGEVTVTGQDETVIVGEGWQSWVPRGGVPDDPEPLEPTSQLRVTFSSPAWMQVVDPLDRSAGIVPPGISVNQIPKTTTSGGLDNEQLVDIVDPEDGAFQVVLYGKRDGDFTLTAEALADGLVVAEDSLEGVVSEDQDYLVSLTVEVTDEVISSVELGQLDELVGDPPGNIVVVVDEEMFLPVAYFSADPTEVKPGDAVQFTDESSGSIDSWSWDFGDGETSTERNPSHTYQDSGKYSVSLSVSGPFGENTETKADYINVTGKVEEFGIAQLLGLGLAIIAAVWIFDIVFGLLRKVFKIV